MISPRSFLKPTPARFHEGLLSPGAPWNLANRFLVTLLNSVRALPGRLCSLLGRIWDLREGRRIQHFSRLKCNQPRVPGRPFFAPGNENSNWEVETTVRAAIRSLFAPGNEKLKREVETTVRAPMRSSDPSGQRGRDARMPLSRCSHRATTRAATACAAASPASRQHGSS